MRNRQEARVTIWQRFLDGDWGQVSLVQLFLLARSKGIGQLTCQNQPRGPERWLAPGFVRPASRKCEKYSFGQSWE